MYNFTVNLEPDDNGTIMATFPEVPEAVTFGDDEADALARAPDALETALAGYIVDRRAIPVPAATPGTRTVVLPLLATLKLDIYKAMRERDWRKSDLARALHVNPRQVDRLLDLTHATPVHDLETALEACGHIWVTHLQAA